MSESQRGLKFIAIFEASKGLLAILVGFGLVKLLQVDVEAMLYNLANTFHFNISRHFIELTLNAISHIHSDQIGLIIGFAFAYSSLRFVEAWGLWFKCRWAEWLAALSGSIYLPFELYELYESIHWIKVLITAINIAIVIYVSKDLIKHYVASKT